MQMLIVVGETDECFTLENLFFDTLIIFPSLNNTWSEQYKWWWEYFIKVFIILVVNTSILANAELSSSFTNIWKDKICEQK